MSRFKPIVFAAAALAICSSAYAVSGCFTITTDQNAVGFDWDADNNVDYWEYETGYCDSAWCDPPMGSNSQPFLTGGNLVTHVQQYHDTLGTPPRIHIGVQSASDPGQDHFANVSIQCDGGERLNLATATANYVYRSWGIAYWEWTLTAPCLSNTGSYAIVID